MFISLFIYKVYIYIYIYIYYKLFFKKYLIELKHNVYINLIY